MAQDTITSVLPADLVTALFSQATNVARHRNEVLFRAGDACDGCYRVVDGL
jgi:hypothetical protein